MNIKKVLPWIRYYWYSCLFFLKLRKKLGPRQLRWIKSLEDNPERQCQGWLGAFYNYYTVDSVDYEACCLGEAYILKCREEGKSPVGEKITIGDSNFPILDTDRDTYLSDDTVEYYQLYDMVGKMSNRNDPRRVEEIIEEIEDFNTLTVLNDNQASWTEIAILLRKYPLKFFRRPV